MFSRAISPTPIVGSEDRSTRVGLLVVSTALAFAWSSAPGRVTDLATLGLLLGLATLLVRRAPGAGALMGWLLLASLAAAHIPTLPLPYSERLKLEAVAAFAPLVVFIALGRAARARAPPARLLVVLALTLATLGSLVRLAEVWILFGRPGDATTIVHALRLDLAASLWGAAAWAFAFGFIARALPAARPRTHHGAAWTGAFLGFVLVTSGTPMVFETGANPSQALAIGFHANDVSDVPDGAQIVHLEAAMPRIQRAQGIYDWSNLDAQLAAARERDLDVYLLVSTYPPRWLIDAYPDAVMVDADGVPFRWIDEAPGEHSGRIWDMSFADVRVFEEKADYVHHVVARYGADASVRWVAVQNEPAYPVDWNLLRWGSFDAATVAAFRESLRQEVGGDLDLLHAIYGIEAYDWEDVRPPRIPFGLLGDRWMSFRETLLVDHTTGLMAVAQALTEKPVTTKLMAHFLTRFAEPQAGLSDFTYRALANASEVVSIDLYPATRADLVRQLDYFRAIADGKSIIVAEFNLALGTNMPFSGTRMLSALETIGHTADAVILFTASGHFLYGIDPDSAAMEATRIVQLGFLDRGYPHAFQELLRREITGILEFPLRARDATALAMTG